jgi:hypothetical protein
MKIIINFAIASLIFFSACYGSSSLDRFTDQKIFSFFEDTALSWTFSSLSKSEERLCKKNMDEMNIYLSGNWDSESKYIFKRCAEDIGRLTDLNVSFVDSQAYCNIYVGMGSNSMKDYYEDWQEKRGIYNQNFDAFIWNLDNNFHIKHSAGFVNEKFKNNQEKLEHFSYRILLVSLGFTNYSSMYYGSIFSRPPTNPSRSLSNPIPLDRAIVKLLYQKEVKPKMTMYDIKKIARSNKLLNKIRN